MSHSLQAAQSRLSKLWGMSQFMFESVWKSFPSEAVSLAFSWTYRQLSWASTSLPITSWSASSGPVAPTNSFKLYGLSGSDVGNGGYMVPALLFCAALPHRLPGDNGKITHGLPGLGSQWQCQRMESEAQLRQVHHMTSGRKGAQQQEGLGAGSACHGGTLQTASCCWYSSLGGQQCCCKSHHVAQGRVSPLQEVLLLSCCCCCCCC